MITALLVCSLIFLLSACGEDDVSIRLFNDTTQFVFTGNSSSNNVSSFKVDRNSGGLSSESTAAIGGAQPRALAVDPFGQFLVATDGTTQSLSTAGSPAFMPTIGRGRHDRRKFR